MLLLDQFRHGLTDAFWQQHRFERAARVNFIKQPAMATVEAAHNFGRLGTSVCLAQILLQPLSKLVVMFTSRLTLESASTR